MPILCTSIYSYICLEVTAKYPPLHLLVVFRLPAHINIWAKSRQSNGPLQVQRTTNITTFVQHESEHETCAKHNKTALKHHFTRSLPLSLYMPGMKKKNRSTVPHTKSCGLTTNDCPTKGQYPEFGLYVPYIECSVKRRLYAFSVLTLCSGILRRTENHSTGVFCWGVRRCPGFDWVRFKGWFRDSDGEPVSFR